MASRSHDKLSEQQKRFVDALLSDPDMHPQEAAREAGYSERTLNSQAYQLLRNPKISRILDKEMAARASRTRITKDRVLREVASLAFSNIDDYEIDYMGNVSIKDGADPRAMKAISSLERTMSYDKEGNPIVKVKLKLWDKGKSVEMLSRHLNLFKEDQEAGAPKNVERYTVEAQEFAAKLLSNPDAFKKKEGDDATD